MTERTTPRPMSESERETLEGMLDAQANRKRRWVAAVGNTIVLWAASTLVAAVVWALVAWLLRVTLGWNVGWYSPVATWVMAVIVPACGLLAIRSTVLWVKSWPDHRDALRADLTKGIVIDEVYRVTGAKRFQEPEHGGLIYFLRTDGDRVLTLYDHESQDLGAGGEDPLQSTFRPRSELTMTRAPATELVLEKRFSGEPIEGAPILEMTLAPREWPENESFCDVPWNDLERRFGNKAAGSDGGA